MKIKTQGMPIFLWNNGFNTVVQFGDAKTRHPGHICKAEVVTQRLLQFLNLVESRCKICVPIDDNDFPDDGSSFNNLKLRLPCTETGTAAYALVFALDPISEKAALCMHYWVYPGGGYAANGYSAKIKTSIKEMLVIVKKMKNELNG